MSGHSKWATIKRKKGALDAKRSKMFTKVIKEISVSVKAGGSDPQSNPRLRLAVSNAKGVNMPKENIERAIKKASDKDSANLIETTYEGYGPNGIGIYVECLTDNINRTIGNIRPIFTKYGGSLSTKGSLEFLFDRKGVFTVHAHGIDEDEFMLNVIDAGAEDVENEDNFFVIYTSFEDFGSMQKKLEQMNVQTENAEIQRVPRKTNVLDADASKKILKMIEAFDEDDDVQNVFHNLELTDQMIAGMS